MRASRRFGQPSSGATTCSTRPRNSFSNDSLSSPVGGRSSAVEQVCDADVDMLQSLVDKSLVRARDNERFFMLETIREFAAELLDDSAALRRRHAAFYLAEAVAAAPGLESGRLERFDRIDNDLPNFRAAFDWLLHNEPDDALRLADALRDFWFARGYLHEGRRWCAAALDSGANDDSMRARTLSSAAILASLQADWPETRRLAEEGSRVSKRLGDPTAVAQSLLTLGRALLAEGDPTALSVSSTRPTRSRPPPVPRGSSGWRDSTPATSSSSAATTSVHGSASSRPEHSSSPWTTPTAPRGRSPGSAPLPCTRAAANDAVSPLCESIELSNSMGDRENMVWALELLGVASLGSDRELAARLLGAAEALREVLGSKLEGIELALHERALAAIGSLRRRVGRRPRAVARRRGRARASAARTPRRRAAARRRDPRRRRWIPLGPSRFSTAPTGSARGACGLGQLAADPRVALDELRRRLVDAAAPAQEEQRVAVDRVREREPDRRDVLARAARVARARAPDLPGPRDQPLAPVLGEQVVEVRRLHAALDGVLERPHPLRVARASRPRSRRGTRSAASVDLALPHARA